MRALEVTFGSNAAPALSRRRMLAHCSSGFGLAALSALLSDAAFGAFAGRDDRLGRQAASFRPQGQERHLLLHVRRRVARRLIRSQAAARARSRQADADADRTDAVQQQRRLMASPWKFRSYGQSGLPVSELFPHVGGCADELAVIRSMTAKFSEHAQGNYFMHTGFPFMGNPSAGAWVTYGLGSENQNLPGFVVLRSGDSAVPHGGVGLFSNGFLPATHQASLVEADAAEPVRNVTPREPGVFQRQRIDFIANMDRRFVDDLPNDSGRRIGDSQLRDRLSHASRRAGTGRLERRDGSHAADVRP